MEKTLAVVSGGLDSVTLAHYLDDEDRLAAVVSFDYGQRHRKELDFAQDAADRLDVPWTLVPLMHLGASALTADEIEVPDGHYAEDSMKATVVPNRNAVMISLATSIAIDHGYDTVAVAVHGGDHFIYPDCRPEFIFAMQTATRLAALGTGSPSFRLEAPFLWWTKAQIVDRGASIRVPFEETWSCYQGGEMHCGSCGTCYERREAFKLAGVKDRTVYAQ